MLAGLCGVTHPAASRAAMCAFPGFVMPSDFCQVCTYYVCIDPPCSQACRQARVSMPAPSPTTCFRTFLLPAARSSPSCSSWSYLQQNVSTLPITLNCTTYFLRLPASCSPIQPLLQLLVVPATESFDSSDQPDCTTSLLRPPASCSPIQPLLPAPGRNCMAVTDTFSAKSVYMVCITDACAASQRALPSSASSGSWSCLQCAAAAS